MPKAPTKKSRMIANVGVGLIVVALVLDAWFSPPLPRLSTPALGLVALLMMQMAKQSREAEGVEIPVAVMNAGSWIANIEVAIALADGLCVMAILAMEVSGASTHYQQVATIATLVLFAMTIVAFRFTRARFDAMMKAAGVDLTAS